jgi:hypothetical protein
MTITGQHFLKYKRSGSGIEMYRVDAVTNERLPTASSGFIFPSAITERRDEIAKDLAA